MIIMCLIAMVVIGLGFELLTWIFPAFGLFISSIWRVSWKITYLFWIGDFIFWMVVIFFICGLGD